MGSKLVEPTKDGGKKETIIEEDIVKEYEEENEAVEDIDDDAEGMIYIGADHYKDKSSIIWFEVGNKAFPTKQVKSFMMMRLAKAEHDFSVAKNQKNKKRQQEMETKVMAYTYELMMAMIPVRHKEEFAEHLMDAEYDEDTINREIERVITLWANNGKNESDVEATNVIPLAQSNDMPGPSTQQQDSLTLRQVSLSKRTVNERPLTEEEIKTHQNLMKKRAVNER